MARAERYQITLIVLGIIATILMGVFFYREFFPEYKIYQDDYIALEEFRSTYTGEPPPDFKVGVKQIVQEREDKGPPDIDRCISCHIALQLPHFSPTKIAHDINGNIVRDIDGTPVQETNENYIWLKLDQKIAELTDAKVNEQLKQQGESNKVASRLKEAEKLKALKTSAVGDHVYDVSKVLSMHPLIGKETRPFEFHSLEEYGCVSCHNGNGKGLTTERAHGPVFDGEYEVEFMGPKLEFLEKDQANDPKFSRVFNDKPGHKLLFQTTPIFVGSLIQAKCVQCHEQNMAAFEGLANTASAITGQRIKRSNAIIKGYENEKSSLLTLLELKAQLVKDGSTKVAAALQQKLENPALLPAERDRLRANLALFTSKPVKDQKQLMGEVDKRLVAMLGSSALEAALSKILSESESKEKVLNSFIEKEHNNPEATGTLFAKWEAINLEQALLRHVEDTQISLSKAASDETAVSAMASDIDLLTKNYHRGQQLFVSQACYACHRISGFARGGVGPELSRAGESYPWYLKESIIWPQADLKTSTMPNFQLDHMEVEDLMTFLLGQKGPNRAVSVTEYKIALRDWEAGKKMPWEKPISPTQMRDLRYSMTVFATQGCAACHRLKGYESNVGYSIEKGNKPAFNALYAESQWFQKLFPEHVKGSDIVQVIDKLAEEIDKRIIDGVRQDSLIEEIEKRYPGSIESLYSNFRFASRAKNDAYAKLADKELDSEKKKAILKQKDDWKQRVNRVLMMYIQEYGLGRLIGPKPNWSGVFRSDEWLMEHFRNPAGHVPRSIMPILPFDDSKFYALTYMLDVLGRQNRNSVRGIWLNRGFNPEQAFNIHCAQCHGDYLQGNGPIATWIYPIPKNLRNAEFLRNLTREEAYRSIMHGIKGTPMPPWGETPSDKMDYDGIPVLTREEINKLVDWLYTSLPGATVIKGIQDVPKWQYTPKDVIDELKREGLPLKPEKVYEKHESGSLPIKDPATAGFSRHEMPEDLLALFPKGDSYYASLKPQVAAVAKPDEQREIDEIFDTVPNLNPGESKHSYFIKKIYYTDYNIEKGKKFFEMNCASCHGKDADGSGMRASIMFDAKPRMLTNLDWIKTHDDIRLLRSIKYGVPGTAMTPWGDQTSALQRLQLVIFIRSLTEEKELRESLSEVLYKTFEVADAQIEMARALTYPNLESLEVQSKKLRSKGISGGDIAENVGEASFYNEALKIYEQQLKLAKQEKEWETLDQQLLALKALVKQEKDIYMSMGVDLIGLQQEYLSNFLKAVKLAEGSFVFHDKALHMEKDEAKYKERIILLEGIAAKLGQENAALNKKVKELPENEQSSLKAKADKYQQAKIKIMVGIEQLKKLGQEESHLFKAYQDKLTELTQQAQ